MSPQSEIRTTPDALLWPDFTPAHFAQKYFAASEDDVADASQHMLSFWVGASSPLWVPFMASASYGLGAWAITQGMRQGQQWLKEMPGSFWLNSECVENALLHNELTETVKEAAPSVPHEPIPLTDPAEVFSQMAATMMSETMELATRTIETVTGAMDHVAAEAGNVVALTPLQPQTLQAQDLQAKSIETEAALVDAAAEAIPSAIPPVIPKAPSRRRPARKA